MVGSSDGLTSDLTIDVPPDAVEAYVADIAAELDRGPIDAELAWVDDQVELTGDSRNGRTLDREATVAAVTASLTGDGAPVDLPFEQLPPTVDDDLAQGIAERATETADAVLDHPVTVTLDGATHTVTARDLDAVPDVTAVLDTALRAADPDAVDADAIDLTIADEPLAGFLDTVTAGTSVAARDATLDVSGGGFRVTPEQLGAAVDRAEASTSLRSALAGDDDLVALSLDPVRPAITTDDFDQVLVVRQSARTVELLRGGAIVREWPVAVGTGGSPTPTGTFVVGAMRYEPTWVNPAKDRWGADMPDRIGPGPDNPLGLRAVNWNTLGGSDTLIRFHGTPNEASIGSASSNGCVRMFNADVVELYDMVSSGMTIVSVA